MLNHFIRHAHRARSPVHPRIVISVPSGITQVERRAVQESAMQAGARRVYLVSEPVAAAVGAGLPITDPGANMIVDIGGGTTEVAVISLSGIVFSTSLRLGGDDMNDAIALHVRKSHGLLIGERRSEDIKIQLGSAYPQPDDVAPMAVKGRDLTSGLPKTVAVTVAEVREALREPVTAIVEAVRACLEQTPPELAADIVDKGIVLTGGGALLRRPRPIAQPRDGPADLGERRSPDVRRARGGARPRRFGLPGQGRLRPLTRPGRQLVATGLVVYGCGAESEPPRGTDFPAEPW